MPETNVPVATPTAFLGYGAGGPGTVTGAQAANLIGGAGLYSGFRDVVAVGTITSADIGKLIDVAGNSLSLTLAAAGFTAGKHVGVINSSTPSVLISAGSGNGINRSGVDSFTLQQDQAVIIVYKQAGNPIWRLGFDDFLSLGPNQHASVNSAGLAQEARGENGNMTLDIIINAGSDGNYGAWRAPWPGTLDTVKHKTRAGLATVQMKKNASNMTGFGSAVGMTSTEGSVTCGDTFAAGDYMVPRVAAVSSLTADADAMKGAYVTLGYTRTGP